MNVNAFEAVSDDDDQSKVISSNVKNRVRSRVICAIKVLAYVAEVFEIRVFNDGMPLAQHVFGSRMLQPKFSEHSDGDNVHAKLYQFDILSQTTGKECLQTWFENYELL